MLTVYLLHFSARVGTAQHYVGQTTRDPAVRLAEHLAGRGGRLPRAAARAGIEVRVVRTWEAAPTSLERALKRGGKLRRLCPVCSPQVIATES